MGIELFPVVYTVDNDNTYLFELGRAIRNKYNALQVTIHPVSGYDAVTDSKEFVYENCIDGIEFEPVKENEEEDEDMGR